jgi:hypothetical protein
VAEPPPEYGKQEVVALLSSQHEQIRELFDGALEADADGRRQSFAELRYAVAMHESADYVVIHPRLRQVIGGSADLIDALMLEELAIERALGDLEGIPLQTDHFRVELARLRDMIAEHIRHEDADEFPLLNQLDPLEGRRLARAVQTLSGLAISGSEGEYPHADLAPGSPNMMVGPFAAILDRARQFLVLPSDE